MSCTCNGSCGCCENTGCSSCENTGCTCAATPESVCVTNPCSTAQNIAALQAGHRPSPGTNCTPIFPEESALEQRCYRSCTDPNGCTGLYPLECRDTFWPLFAHPRWLCCADLYSGN